MKKEQQIEQELITKLKELKYTYRQDICDKATLEKNFRQKFETLNRISLTDAIQTLTRRNYYGRCIHRSANPA